MDRTEPKIVTMADVARAAGVSTSTVSRVLTGSHRVRESRERRVHEAAARLGYRMNAAARALRRRHTMTLGIVCQKLQSPMQMSILSGLSSETQSRGYSLLVTSADSSAALYDSLIQKLFEARVDGLFLDLPLHLTGSEMAFINAGIPVVALFARDSTAHHLPLVTADESGAIRQAVERLVNVGHRRFGHLLTTLDSEISDRASSLDSALKASGHEISLAVELVEASDAAARRRGAKKILAHRPRPTVVFTSDLFLRALLEEASSRGLAVPQDLSLVVYEHVQATELLAPSISTVSVDANDIGRVAAQVMLDWLAGEKPAPVTYAMPAEWLEGSSTGPAPPCSD